MTPQFKDTAYYRTKIHKIIYPIRRIKKEIRLQTSVTQVNNDDLNEVLNFRDVFKINEISMHPFVCFGGKQNGCNNSVLIDKSDGIER